MGESQAFLALYWNIGTIFFLLFYALIAFLSNSGIYFLQQLAKNHRLRERIGGKL